jgi:hypothetical protein
MERGLRECLPAGEVVITFVPARVVEEEESAVERIALVATLKPGLEERARNLVLSGPPFDPAAAGLARHVVYLSAGDVVFVFEGRGVERRLHELVTAPSQSELTSALDEWRDIVEGPARIARASYAWDAEAEARPTSKPGEPTTSPVD